MGRLKPGDFTFGSLMTDEGKVKVYLGEGRLLRDPIPDNFFGVAGVAEIRRLQDVLLHVGAKGHRHHVSITPGRVQAPCARRWATTWTSTVDLPQAGVRRMAELWPKSCGRARAFGIAVPAFNVPYLPMMAARHSGGRRPGRLRPDRNRPAGVDQVRKPGTGGRGGRVQSLAGVRITSGCTSITCR